MGHGGVNRMKVSPSKKANINIPYILMFFNSGSFVLDVNT